MKSAMRVFGILVVLAGLALLGHGYMADTTVPRDNGTRIANLPLIEQQRKEMMAGGIVAGVGAVLFLAGEIGGKS